MARGLLDLPFEILAQICQSWCSHCVVLGPDLWDEKPTTAGRGGSLAIDRAPDGAEKQATLSRVSQTCRHLRAVAQPILFHDFTTFKPQDLFSLVRTLLWRPDLGHQVQRLSLSTGGSGCIYDHQDAARFHAHARHLSLSLSPGTLAILSQPLTRAQQDGQPLQQGCSVPAMAEPAVFKDLLLLLLPLAPHVKEGFIQLLPDPQRVPGAPATAGHATLRLPEMRKLAFSPRGATTPSWFSQPDVLPVMICPKLDILHLSFCTEPPHFGAARGLQHLTVLRISGCRVSMLFLKDMLAQLGPHLTSFTLILGYLWTTEATGGLLPDDVTPRQVIEGLLPWRQTLRTVRINLSKAMPRAIKLRKTDLITSCAHFDRLEVLELDMSCLYIAQLDGLLMFGVDTAQADWDLLVNLLPESARDFVLNGPTHRVYDALEELSDRAATGKFKNLVKVRCDDGPIAHLEHLRERFGMAGVSFSFRVPKYGFRHTLSGLF